MNKSFVRLGLFIQNWIYLLLCSTFLCSFFEKIILIALRWFFTCLCMPLIYPFFIIFCERQAIFNRRTFYCLKYCRDMIISSVCFILLCVNFVCLHKTIWISDILFLMHIRPFDNFVCFYAFQSIIQILTYFLRSLFEPKYYFFRFIEYIMYLIYM